MRIMYSSHADTSRSWIDFNNDFLIRQDQQDYDPITVQLDWAREFDQVYEDDETFASLSPFLAVYDWDHAVKQKTLDWSDRQALESELIGPNGYITERGNRIHFNRYSGVIMR